MGIWGWRGELCGRAGYFRTLMVIQLMTFVSRGWRFGKSMTYALTGCLAGRLTICLFGGLAAFCFERFCDGAA